MTQSLPGYGVSYLIADINELLLLYWVIAKGRGGGHAKDLSK